MLNNTAGIEEEVFYVHTQNVVWDGPRAAVPLAELHMSLGHAPYGSGQPPLRRRHIRVRRRPGQPSTVGIVSVHRHSSLIIRPQSVQV
jgi:hypothetical protein